MQTSRPPIDVPAAFKKATLSAQLIPVGQVPLLQRTAQYAKSQAAPKPGSVGHAASVAQNGAQVSAVVLLPNCEQLPLVLMQSEASRQPW
jgi:hypothetical protein